MSSYLAIATVTETLRQMLDAAVNKDISGGARATVVRPEGTDKTSLDGLPELGVNAYLYRICFNSAWRNDDLPMRRADGTLSKRPRAAIDLNYLLTFYGDEKRLEPHRVAGSVIGALHARPVLTRAMIRNAVISADFLQGSDLADEIELVKFIPLNLSIEELQNLWSGFFQAPCALSAAYQASVVFIDGDAMPQEALPVKDSGIRSVPFRQPIIERIEASDKKPIIFGASIIISGRNMMGEMTRIRVGDVEVQPLSQFISDSSIILGLSSPPFPPGSLYAGIQKVQVVQNSMAGSPPTPHWSGESNAMPFVLRPVIESVKASSFRGKNGLLSGEVTISLRPNLGKSQRSVIILNEISGEAPGGYTFIVPPREKDTDIIKMALEGMKPGEYLVRVQVDGAESLLFTCNDIKSSDYGRYIGPSISIKER